MRLTPGGNVTKLFSISPTIVQINLYFPCHSYRVGHVIATELDYKKWVNLIEKSFIGDK
jgi:hypothetical protein